MPNTIATFDNIVIDRVVDAWFEKKNADGTVGDLLAVLDQVTNFSINTTSESKDKTDAQGVLLKRYFTSKSVEISGENATFSLNLFATQNGVSKVVDTDVVIPRIYQATVPASGTITLPEAPIAGTFQLYGTSANGNVDVDKKFTAASGVEPTPGDTTYVLTGTSLALPTSLSEGATVQIKYNRHVTSGTKAARVDVAGDKFPKECKATFRVLCSDLCNSEEVYALYIVFEKFQMSPDFDWSVDTESNQSFTATAFKDFQKAVNKLAA